jgi:hypothetical protein
VNFGRVWERARRRRERERERYCIKERWEKPSRRSRASGASIQHGMDNLHGKDQKDQRRHHAMLLKSPNQRNHSQQQHLPPQAIRCTGRGGSWVRVLWAGLAGIRTHHRMGIHPHPHRSLAAGRGDVLAHAGRSPRLASPLSFHACLPPFPALSQAEGAQAAPGGQFPTTAARRGQAPLQGGGIAARGLPVRGNATRAPLKGGP